MENQTLSTTTSKLTIGVFIAWPGQVTILRIVIRILLVQTIGLLEPKTFRHTVLNWKLLKLLLPMLPRSILPWFNWLRWMRNYDGAQRRGLCTGVSWLSLDCWWNCGLWNFIHSHYLHHPISIPCLHHIHHCMDLVFWPSTYWLQAIPSSHLWRGAFLACFSAILMHTSATNLHEMAPTPF